MKKKIIKFTNNTQHEESNTQLIFYKALIHFAIKCHFLSCACLFIYSIDGRQSSFYERKLQIIIPLIILDSLLHIHKLE